jgi:hypothetical protein
MALHVDNQQELRVSIREADIHTNDYDLRCLGTSPSSPGGLLDWFSMESFGKHEDESEVAVAITDKALKHGVTQISVSTQHRQYDVWLHYRRAYVIDVVYRPDS